MNEFEIWEPLTLSKSTRVYNIHIKRLHEIRFHKFRSGNPAQTALPAAGYWATSAPMVSIKYTYNFVDNSVLIETYLNLSHILIFVFLCLVLFLVGFLDLLEFSRRHWPGKCDYVLSHNVREYLIVIVEHTDGLFQCFLKCVVPSFGTRAMAMAGGPRNVCIILS